jgi:hypothetical protein
LSIPKAITLRTAIIFIVRTKEKSSLASAAMNTIAAKPKIIFTNWDKQTNIIIEIVIIEIFLKLKFKIFTGINFDFIQINIPIKKSIKLINSGNNPGPDCPKVPIL